MFTPNEQLATLGQAQFEKAVRLSGIVMSSAERFANLQMELGKKLMNDNAQNVKQLTEIKDPKSLMAFQSSLTQPAVDQAMTTARSVYDAAVLTQNEVQNFIEDQLLEFNKQLCSNLDKIAKNAPAGSDAAISAIKNVLTSATAAYDNVAKTAKKVSTELAEAGVEAANAAVTQTAAAAASATSAATNKKA